MKTERDVEWRRLLNCNGARADIAVEDTAV
jgi:hypothetical protein